MTKVKLEKIASISEKSKKIGKSAQKRQNRICYSDESVKKTLLILCKCDSIRQDVGNVTENDSKVTVFYQGGTHETKNKKRKKEV